MMRYFVLFDVILFLKFINGKKNINRFIIINFINMYVIILNDWWLIGVVYLIFLVLVMFFKFFFVSFFNLCIFYFFFILNMLF